jgi:histidine ammonia-lyase
MHVAAGALDPATTFKLSMDEQAVVRIARASEQVGRIVTSGKRTYGINTGLGDFAEVAIPSDKLSLLQINLIRSHCCGVGEELSRDLVMAMSLIRLNTICRGHSGTHPKTVERMILLLESGILPCVPSRGSVGASGDLAPSAHAALNLIGEGYCTLPKRKEFLRVSANEALTDLGLKPLTLGPKEGLSLINGTQLTTALALKAWFESENLLANANLAAAMTIEGLNAQYRRVPLAALREHRHPGTLSCGREIASWLYRSKTQMDGLTPASRTQDPYSIRCAPHVHGMVRDELSHAEVVIEREINASDDNPLLFPETEEVLSCGNFHAIQPARVSDKLASALTTLGTISERRINIAMTRERSGLPNFLIRDGGLNSGFMMAQVTAAALASECKTLSVPASIDSIPTNCDREDHVSMGPLAGLKALQIVERMKAIIAIELLVAAQAIDLSMSNELPLRLAKAHQTIRQVVPFLDEDRVLSIDIDALTKLVASGDLVRHENHENYNDEQ